MKNLDNPTHVAPDITNTTESVIDKLINPSFLTIREQNDNIDYIARSIADLVLTSPKISSNAKPVIVVLMTNRQIFSYNPLGDILCRSITPEKSRKLYGISKRFQGFSPPNEEYLATLTSKVQMLLERKKEQPSRKFHY